MIQHRVQYLKKNTCETFARKILHMAMGGWIFTWFLFDSRLGAVIVPIIATISLAVGSQSLQKKFSEEQERHIGLVIYAFSITLLTLIFWEAKASRWRWIGAGSFLSLAWGDGLGGVIGETYGRHIYTHPWMKEKSLEGSLGVVLGSFVAFFLAQLVFGHTLNLYLIALGTCIVTILEGVSPRNTDNFFVPLVSAILLVAFTTSF